MIDDDPLDGMKVHCEIHRRGPGREHPGHRHSLSPVASIKGPEASWQLRK
jgi:hypothetical protein